MKMTLLLAVLLFSSCTLTTASNKAEAIKNWIRESKRALKRVTKSRKELRKPFLILPMLSTLEELLRKILSKEERKRVFNQEFLQNAASLKSGYSLEEGADDYALYELSKERIGTAHVLLNA